MEATITSGEVAPSPYSLRDLPSQSCPDEDSGSDAVPV
jgi:hypothetical protein